MKINIASFYIILHDRKNISFIHFFHVVKLIWSLNSWIFRSVIMSYVLAIDMKIPKWWYKNMSYCLLSIIAQYPRTLEINKILIRVLCIVHENDEQKWDIFHPGMLECIKVHTLNDMKTIYNLFFDEWLFGISNRCYSIMTFLKAHTEQLVGYVSKLRDHATSLIILGRYFNEERPGTTEYIFVVAIFTSQIGKQSIMACSLSVARCSAEICIAHIKLTTKFACLI